MKPYQETRVSTELLAPGILTKESQMRALVSNFPSNPTFYKAKIEQLSGYLKTLRAEFRAQTGIEWTEYKRSKKGGL